MFSIILYGFAGIKENDFTGFSVIDTGTSIFVPYSERITLKVVLPFPLKLNSLVFTSKCSLFSFKKFESL